MLAEAPRARNRLLRIVERFPPHGWLDVLFQFGLFAIAYLIYSLVRGFAEANNVVAFAHAYDVVHLERSLHVFIEPQLQAWALGSRPLMDLASWLYVNAQTTVTIGAILYIYLRRNEAYHTLRNMLAIGMVIALISYAVFPTAPPRFLPEFGFVDSVANFTGVHVNHSSASMSALLNPYAAVPSMHVAFAVMIGSRLALVVRRRALKVLWAAYPLLITFVVIATANHFIFDAATGALTAIIAAYAAKRIAYLRPFASKLIVTSTRAAAQGLTDA